MPVELVEGGEFFQPGEGVEAAGEGAALGLDAADLAADFAESGFELAALRFEGLDLGGVAPAQHVAAAVGDGVAVVLLVAAAGVLDLAGAGDRTRLAAELLLGGAAGDVEAVGELALEPVVVRAVGLDRELAHQRVGVQRGQLAGARRADVEIHQAAAQVVAVHPLGHRLVVRVGHQQGEAEAAQQALGGALPVALVLAHLQQLAGEGHVLDVDAERAAQRGADLDLAVVDVAAPAPEAVDLGAQRVVFELALAQADGVLGERVLQLGVAVARVLAARGEVQALGGEGLAVGGGGGAEHRGELGVAARLGQARVAHLRQLADLGGEALEAVAAVGVDGLLERVDAQRLLLAQPVQAPGLGVGARPLLGGERQAVVEQGELARGEVRLQRLAAAPQRADVGGERVVAVAVFDQRGEQRHLALGLEHRLVGAVEVVEVADEGLDARADLEGLEHVVAHEVGEVADRLHRHGLVEELERLLVVDAEAAAEPGGVGREAVEDLGARAAQALAQLGDVGAEAGEVRGDRQRVLGAEVEARRLALWLLEPEHLGQAHGLVVAGVVEHAEDHRVAAGLAQAERARGAGDLVALGLVVAEHVGAQAALAGVGAGGLVVGDAVGGDEQRGDRIDQGGLARADVAGEQPVAAVELQRPHVAVEGAPVEHLQALQAKAGEGVVGDEVEAEGLRLIHRASPSRRRGRRGSRRGGRRSRRAIARRRRP